MESGALDAHLKGIENVSSTRVDSLCNRGQRRRHPCFDHHYHNPE